MSNLASIGFSCLVRKKKDNNNSALINSQFAERIKWVLVLCTQRLFLQIISAFLLLQGLACEVLSYSLVARIVSVSRMLAMVWSEVLLFQVTDWGYDSHSWPLPWVSPEGTWRAGWPQDSRVNDWSSESAFPQHEAFSSWQYHSFLTTALWHRERIFSPLYRGENIDSTKIRRMTGNNLVWLFCLNSRKLKPKFWELWADG